MEIDYDVSVFIITEFNEYVLPEDYDKNNDGDGIFVCLTNDRLNSDYGFNNSICIHRNWRNKLSKAREQFFKNTETVNEDNGYITSIWQKEFKEIPNNERYNIDKRKWADSDKDEYLIECLDGYLGCKSIMSNVTPLLKDNTGKQIYTIDEYIPAIMLTYHTKAKFNGQWYNGYLPAIGQLMFLSANISKTNFALNAIGEQIEQFKIKENYLLGCWWSSSQYGANSAWNLIDGSSDLYGKQSRTQQVLPLFAV